ncbi:hypothetical protein F5Y14DRAFT_462542 [Nemania sp. NC0429]|nr:hypothetical protein F5Y14DRAFT_462542 [Nemania sp. NC0429]
MEVDMEFDMEFDMESDMEFDMEDMEHSMEVDLDGVLEGTTLASYQAVLNMLKATLEYPADNTDLKATKLAEDIQFMCRQAHANCDGDGGVLLYIWWIVIAISQYIPPGHPWQECLIEAVGNLRQLEGPVPGMPAHLWRDLPYLLFRLQQLWIDPVEGDEWLADDIELDEALISNDFVRWKNQNSFAARLTSASFHPGLIFPIGQLRTALEAPTAKGPIQECRLWVACEWIIHCAGVIYNDMVTEQNPDSAFKTGSLCRPGMPHFGTERWEFWKKRFGEISKDAKNLKLGNSMVERISAAVEIMNEAQKEHSIVLEYQNMSLWNTPALGHWD